MNESEEKNTEEGDTKLEEFRTQYNRLTEDSRQFHNMLWGIPSVAVSIMAGIVIVAYQAALEGWPRFVLLAVGSLFLFALTLEVIKKRLLMNIVSNRLNTLQGKNGLKLNENIQFSTDLKEAKCVWTEISNKQTRKEDWLFRNLMHSATYGREFLAWVIFLAAIAIAILAALDLFGMIAKYFHIVLPLELP